MVEMAAMRSVRQGVSHSVADVKQSQQEHHIGEAEGADLPLQPRHGEDLIGLHLVGPYNGAAARAG